MIEEYVVSELKLYDEDTDEEELRLTTSNDHDYPLKLAAFDSDSDYSVMSTSLSRNECKELRDFLNSLDLD